MPRIQPAIPAPSKDISLEGNIALITGGTSGIGLEAARQFLALKASRVIITARNASKGAEAVQALREDPEVKRANPNASIEFLVLDLDDYSSVMQFCDQVKKEIPLLNILVGNAGVTLMEYRKSTSGHEQTMQVNCYSHFLLILELLPLLQKTAATTGYPSHLTITGSSMQSSHSLASKPIPQSRNILEYFDDPKAFSAMRRYNDSKLAVNAFMRHLATIVPSSEVIINSFCPGAVTTNLEHNAPWYVRGLVRTFKRSVGRPIRESGYTVVHAAYVAGEESHGKFLNNNLIESGAPFLDEDAGKDFIKRLWNDSLADFEKLDPSLKNFVA